MRLSIAVALLFTSVTTVSAFDAWLAWTAPTEYQGELVRYRLCFDPNREGPFASCFPVEPGECTPERPGVAPACPGTRVQGLPCAELYFKVAAVYVDAGVEVVSQLSEVASPNPEPVGHWTTVGGSRCDPFPGPSAPRRVDVAGG